MNSIQVQDGQNIYDIATKKFGDVSKVLLVVLDNKQNLDYDLTGIRTINYTPANYVIPAISKILQKEAQKPTSYITVYGQNIYDVALQLYANPSNVFSITETSLDDDIEHNVNVQIKEFKSPFVAQKLAIDLTGRIIGTKDYKQVFYTYIGTETRVILTTESGLRFILE